MENVGGGPLVLSADLLREEVEREGGGGGKLLLRTSLATLTFLRATLRSRRARKSSTSSPRAFRDGPRTRRQHCVESQLMYRRRAGIWSRVAEKSCGVCG